MSKNQQLDLDLLRTLVTVADEGSFTRAASRIGRTQAAVSLQIKRLEAVVGRDLVHRRRGGAVDLNEAGKTLYEEARRLLAQSELVLQKIRSPDVRSDVRLGVWEGYAKTFLAPVLGRFSAAHPMVSIEIFSGLSCQLLPLMMQNRLDALVCDDGMEPPGWPKTALLRTRLRWVAADHWTKGVDPLSVSLGSVDCPWRPQWLPECLWRSTARRSLQSSGLDYRVAPSLTSIAGWDSAVLSGQAITVSTLGILPPGLRYVGEAEGLPELPDQAVLILVTSQARQPITDLLVDYLKTQTS